MLFQHAVGGQPIREALAAVRPQVPEAAWPLVEELCMGTVGHAAALDRVIARYLSGWTLDRLANVDRVVLRMALHELRALATSPGVVISEAVDLAKRYGTEASGAFVNGVLGAIVRDGAQDAGSKPGAGRR